MDSSGLLDENGIPYIRTILDDDFDRPMHPLYLRAVCECLANVMPRNFFVDHLAAGMSKGEVLNELHSRMPLLTRVKPKEAPGALTFTLLSRMRHNAFRFFYEMVCRWLVPGKRLDVQFFYAADFVMPAFSDQVYTLCDLMIKVRDEEELAEIRRNLPTLETELLLGMDDAFVGQRILDIRGLSADEKTAAIQEHISMVRARKPGSFDTDVFEQMQHLLVTCSDKFKEERSYRHLSRIICYHYLFRRELRRESRANPQRRSISMKLMRSAIGREQKRVVALCIGVNFFHRHEVFEEGHILGAVQRHIPEARLVEGSFIGDSARRERVRTLYLELEKEGGVPFSDQELNHLREHLAYDLKDCVEHLMHPIFMPRNEEETMRDILALANQIKYVRDLPQVIISFDEQTHNDLVFTVIVVKTLRDETISVKKLVQERCSLTYHHDRVKLVGLVRKRYPKQATVFRVSMPKSRFLRTNHSIDLQSARQLVVEELTNAIGEFRDYNGGMIAKQTEALNAVRQLVGGDAKAHDFALQNLFYSIEPPVMRNVLEPSAISHLFDMSHCQRDLLSVSEDKEHFYAIIDTEDPAVRREAEKRLSKLHIPGTELAKTTIEIHGRNALGLIYRSEDHEMRHRLQALLEGVVGATVAT